MKTTNLLKYTYCKFSIYSSIIFFLVSNICLSQKETSDIFNGCATDVMMQNHPELLKKQKDIDTKAYDFFTGSRQPSISRGIMTIPVVVHIVHNGGSENISDVQVQNAIANINAKFKQNNGTQIQFCLAQRDPEGNPTNGITRNISMLTTETMEVEDIALKDINRWNPKCYLNIWVVKEILSLSMGSAVIGYAYFPSAHGLNMDGVVIEANFFGISPEIDAIATHEIGHYLGLYHTFQNGCKNDNCLLDGDLICDTPPDQTTFASCSPPTNSCSTDADDPSSNNPFSTDVADQSENYMDYSSLSCYSLFTADQYSRMEYFLTNVRGSLLNCLSCTTPCPTPLTATITSPSASTNTMTGTSVSFTGTAANSIIYQWYINPNTIISTTLSANYTFNSAGNYWMKFRVISSNPSLCLDALDSVLIVVSEPTVYNCNGSLQFDFGLKNSAVNIPDNIENYSSNGFTWECWINITAPFSNYTGFRPIINAVDNVVYEDICLGFGWPGVGYAPVDHLVFHVDAPNGLGGPNSNGCEYMPVGGFQTGIWYHVAGVMNYNTDTARLYLNGALVDQKFVNSQPFSRIIPTRLSWEDVTCPNFPYPSFGGLMDEVRIWRCPRTSTEIAANYNKCMTGNEPDLLVYYRCNQSAGSLANDATSNGNNGTLTPTAKWSNDNPVLTGGNCGDNCDIVACYPFNSNANDESGNGYHGTNLGATLTTDRFGNPNSAYEFDGIDDYIDVSSLPIKQNFSFSFWCNRDNKTNATLIGFDGSYVIHFINSFLLDFWTKAGTTCPSLWTTQINSSSIIPFNQWVHIVWTRDDVTGNQFIYINGLLKKIVNESSSSIPSCPYGKFFGSVKNNIDQMLYYYKGKLDDIIFYNRILSNNEVLSLYNGYYPCSSVVDCPSISINAGNDTTICNGAQVQLNASSGFDTYSWTPSTGLNNPNIQNPVASPVVTTTYTVTGAMLGANLVVNGDFSAGNSGFTSNHYYTSIFSPCNYYVGPMLFTAISFPDHSPSTDNMFMSIDGCNPGTMIWEETISNIQMNENYMFSFWGTRIEYYLPIYEIHFIGNNTGDIIVATLNGIYSAGWIWDQYSSPIWNSTTNTSVIIKVINKQTEVYGNDFGLDDFAFQKMCNYTDSVEVKVENNVAPTLNLGSDISLCESGTHTFDAGAGFEEYLWNDFSINQTYTAYGPGKYWVTVKDSCGGIQSDTVLITLASSPVLNLGEDISICQSDSVMLSYTSSDTIKTYQWSPSAGLSCSVCPHPYAKPLKPTMYYLVGSNQFGCTTIDSIFIDFFNLPQILFTYAIEMECKPFVVKFSISSPGDTSVNYHYLWDFGDGTTSSERNPLHRYSEPGLYSVYLKISREDGCMDSTEQEVLIEDIQTFYAPTVFSPNDDGINDVFSPIGCSIDSNHYYIAIYDRWGEIVFESTCYDIDENTYKIRSGWNGYIKGSKMGATGTYIWYCKYRDLDDIEYTKVGIVTLIR